ncbi:MAG: acyl-CoA thioesterase [Verrucomicrobia bacterium]|nr:acyl-CoA thioesterase [Verrucomicrobiota bacterium]
MTPGKTKFESALQVRPDDLDMFRHVHSSRYMDYVLAARFDQMARCYGVPMEKFLELGFGWVVRTAHLEFKRPLGLGEKMTVRTWVDEITSDSVKVHFEIFKEPARKLACDGWCLYTMVSLKTGRAEPIPDWIAAKYAV